MRKKKRASGARSRAGAGALLLAFAALALVTALGSDAAAAQDGSQMGTQGGGAVIARDPQTGDRVMRTPEPQPQQDYQGPQTIIVSPEVYPGGSSGGNRPPGGNRPHRPDKPRPRN